MSKSAIEYMRVYFGEALSGARSHEQAYEQAAEKFFRIHGVECPYSYTGYRLRDLRARKTKRK